MENVEQTIISQYANSPTLVQLIQNMNQYIDQTANFQAFYDYVWNVNTAQGFGLDVWGRIVGIERQLEVVSPQVYFGFAEAFQGITGAQNSQPFNQAPFYNGKAVTNTFTLGDAAYRQLILAKALANISNLTAPSLNALISKVFSFLPQQGDILGVGKLPFTLYAPAQRAYVQDTGGMQYRVVFEFYPTALQLAIILNSGVFPRPAGVRLQVVEFAPDSTFGFAEAGGTPFGAGTFFSSSGIQNAA